MARPRDSIDALLTSWAARRPDLDFGPVAVIFRLARVRSHLDAELEPVYQRFGLGAADFEALVTLARISDSRGLSQRRLADELGLTSGTVSVRVDRLASQGLAQRVPDPASGRSTLITLTDAGRELFDRAAPAHLANEQRLLATLSGQSPARADRRCPRVGSAEGAGLPVVNGHARTESAGQTKPMAEADPPRHDSLAARLLRAVIALRNDPRRGPLCRSSPTGPEFDTPPGPVLPIPEHTWSTQADKTDTQKMTWNSKTPGQHGCAARDSTPEPAD